MEFLLGIHVSEWLAFHGDYSFLCREDLFAGDSIIFYYKLPVG